MGSSSCIVRDCKNNYFKKRARNEKLSLFRFPKVITHQGEKTLKLSELRRCKWFELILGNFDKLSDSASDRYRLCSDHFLTGKPASLYDTKSPDWLPTQHMPDLSKSETQYSNDKEYDVRYSKPLVQINVARTLADLDLLNYASFDKKVEPIGPLNKPQQTYKLKAVHSGPSPSKSDTIEFQFDQNSLDLEAAEFVEKSYGPKILEFMQNSETDTSFEPSNVDMVQPMCDDAPSVQQCDDDIFRNTNSSEVIVPVKLEDNVPKEGTNYILVKTPFIPPCQNRGNQTSLLMEQINALESELRQRNEEVYNLRSKLKKMTLDEDYFEGDNKKVCFYTGISTYDAFLELLDHVKEDLPSHKMSLTPFQQLMLTCMRIHLDTPQRDLAYRFNVSQATASRIFAHCLQVLNQRLITDPVKLNCDMKNTDYQNEVDGSDSAPEEEGFQISRNNALQERDVLATKVREERRLLKEKRTEVHKRNAAQKQEKMTRILELGGKKLPSAFLEKVTQFSNRKEQSKKMYQHGKRKSDEISEDNIVGDESEIIKVGDTTGVPNYEENYIGLHGQTEFEVVPIDNALSQSTVGNSAMEFKKRKAYGSNIQREPVENLIANERKQAAKHYYSNYPQNLN